jgi:hypothetical protein
VGEGGGCVKPYNTISHSRHASYVGTEAAKHCNQDRVKAVND